MICKGSMLKDDPSFEYVAVVKDARMVRDGWTMSATVGGIAFQTHLPVRSFLAPPPHSSATPKLHSSSHPLSGAHLFYSTSAFRDTLAILMLILDGPTLC